MLAPVGYLELYALSICFQGFDSGLVKDIYTNLINFIQAQSPFFNLVKWLFIVFVITEEIVLINSDINRLELFKNLIVKSDNKIKIQK